MRHTWFVLCENSTRKKNSAEIWWEFMWINNSIFLFKNIYNSANIYMFIKPYKYINTRKERTKNIPKLYETLKSVHQHLSSPKELFLLLVYSSLNFATDWMIRASMPFLCWGHNLWPNKLKLLFRKKIASNILRSEIQNGSLLSF